jgi:hypothetical protein
MPKFGSEHVRAMWRLGLHELRAALYSDSNIAQPTEAGIIGTATPGEVQSRRNSEPAINTEPSKEGSSDKSPEDAPPENETASAPSVLDSRMQIANERAAEPTVPEFDLDLG